MSPISRAISFGFNSFQVLNYIKTQFPQYASTIKAAEKAGFTPDKILKSLSNDTESDDEAYLTEHEKTIRRDKEQKKKATLGLAATAGTAAALGAGAYGYATRNRAVRPSAILPPTSQAQTAGTPTTIPVTGRPIGPRTQPARLPYQPGGGPTAPPSPSGPTIPPTGKGPSPVSPRPTPQPKTVPQSIAKPTAVQTKNVDIVKNLKVEPWFTNILQSGYDLATTTAILKQVLPKNKVAELSKVEGGLEKVVEDYTNYAQENFPELFKPVEKEPQEIQPISEPQPTEIREALPLTERIEEATTDKIPSLPSQEKTELKQNFYIPNYKHPGESPQEFVDRKKLYDVVNKAAKFISSGKSFLDLPIQPEGIKAKGGYSTAADVLRFMAGIPNTYDGLLEEDEKEELRNALSPSLTPTRGENIYGAQLAPNLVWNLLVSIEPNISKYAPPSIKGAKGKPPGSKMGTTELRRFLTHSVYGVLSGKTLSSELADKIEKISKATSHLDAIVKATHAGKTRELQEEMEKLATDDAYFMEIMSQEIESMIKEIR